MLPFTLFTIQYFINFIEDLNQNTNENMSILYGIHIRRNVRRAAYLRINIM